MMEEALSCSREILRAPRWIGDPVDVITGARAEINLDFRIAWRVPFEWRRYWDSTKLGVMGELGHGHAHEYERWMDFTADGLRVCGPLGTPLDFAPLMEDGASTCAEGSVLRRLSLFRYVLLQPGGPDL